MEVDLVVVAIGNSSNPLIPQTTPGLECNRWGNIVVDPETMQTSRKGVYAGGDIVLPKDKSQVIRFDENPALKEHIGDDIITEAKNAIKEIENDIASFLKELDERFSTELMKKEESQEEKVSEQRD